MLRKHHRNVRFVAQPEIVHRGWFAYAQTFCGLAMPMGDTYGFTSNRLTCLPCVCLEQKLDQAWDTYIRNREEDGSRLSLGEEVAFIRMVRDEAP